MPLFASPMYLTPPPPAGRRFHGADYAGRGTSFARRYGRAAAPGVAAMALASLPACTLTRIGDRGVPRDYDRAA